MYSFIVRLRTASRLCIVFHLLFQFYPPLWWFILCMYFKVNMCTVYILIRRLSDRKFRKFFDVNMCVYCVMYPQYPPIFRPGGICRPGNSLVMWHLNFFWRGQWPFLFLIYLDPYWATWERYFYSFLISHLLKSRQIIERTYLWLTSPPTINRSATQGSWAVWFWQSRGAVWFQLLHLAHSFPSFLMC